MKKSSGLYTELEYMECTGSQYIDTDYVCGDNVELHTKFAYSQLDAAFRCIFGVQTATKSADAITVSQNDALNCQAYWGGYNRSPYKFATNTVYDFIFSKNKFVLNSEDYGGYTSTVVPSALTLFLMARNNNKTAGNFFIGRLYGLKLYDNDLLVRDYIPVLDAKGKPCFYEKVERKFYYNQGTGEFLYDL